VLPINRASEAQAGLSRLPGSLSCGGRTRSGVDGADRGSVALTIGQPNPTIDDVLRRKPAGTHAYLTGKAVPESDA